MGSAWGPGGKEGRAGARGQGPGREGRRAGGQGGETKGQEDLGRSERDTKKVRNKPRTASGGQIPRLTFPNCYPTGRAESPYHGN